MKSIDELRALAVGVSSGDWSTSDADPGVVVNAEGRPIAVFGGSQQDYRDAEFTVAARNTIGLLLDRIAELEARTSGGRHG